MKCEINGVKYKSKPVDLTGNPCKGCAAIDDSDLCSALVSCEGKKSVIWVKHVKKPTVKVNGITYKAIKEQEAGSCVGCVAAYDTGLCSQITCKLLGEEHCMKNKTIWAEKKPKVVEPVPEPIPEPVKTVAWVNIYADGERAIYHPTEEIANSRAGADRITCVRIEY